jgi:NAD+ synthase (glutamine-hydrolysing)
MLLTKANTSKTIRIALAQINACVGDFKGNAKKIIRFLKSSQKLNADVILFPELALTGYPPEDLLLKKDFIDENLATLKKLESHTKNIIAAIGYAEFDKGKLYNSAAIFADGKLRTKYRKTCLPNYGVFDEKRYFHEGDSTLKFEFRGVSFGVTICEDIWEENGPGEKLSSLGGVDVLLNLSSSPFYSDKRKIREKLIQKRAQQYKAAIAYVNLIGGQDELVFDGTSLIVNEKGKNLARGKSFQEDLVLFDLEIKSPKFLKKTSTLKKNFKHLKLALPQKTSKTSLLKLTNQNALEEGEEIYRALILGTQDYFQKNGFQKAVLGLSGGIDSALTAAIAVEALGSENVVGILMPSPYSSKGSVNDSLKLAKNLCITTHTIPIAPAMKAFQSMLEPAFKKTQPGIAEENLQARIRGNIVMAFSNKFGWLALTTGNKSETSVGYCTLYGDMAGGFAPIKDVSKNWVYKLSEFFNKLKNNDIIPKKIIKKAPSAELRPNQKDTDSLPDYDLLDSMLFHYIEKDCGLKDLISLGFPKKDAQRIVELVNLSEYKRRQGPPGIKITSKSFGKDRRLPITNAFFEGK